MTLADLPRRVVSLLGPWDEDNLTPRERRLASWRRYTAKNRERRAAAMRAYRARRKAA